jgi:acyl-CoA synthetase (AMP-forming)/AMP-acid ligase II
MLGLWAYFRQLDLQKSDQIALLMDNGLFTVELFLAAMYGGFVVPLNVRAGLPQLTQVLDLCEANVVFVGVEHSALIEQAASQISRSVRVIPVDIDLGILDTPTSTGQLVDASSEDAALLIYSSGSTGLPNGAIHSHKSVLAHGRNLGILLGTDHSRLNLDRSFMT